MSEPRYGPTPAVPTRLGRWRVPVVAGATLLGAPAGVAACFVAIIVWTGCFISCSGPDHLNGGLLAAAGVLLFLSGPVLAGALLRRWSAVGLSVLGVVGSLLFWVVFFGVR